MRSLLIFNWASIAQRRVLPPSVAEVVVIHGLRHARTPQCRSVEQLLLQRREETLLDRVIPTVALTAHPDDDSVPLQRCPVLGARVRDPLFRVLDQALPCLPRPEISLQRRNCEIGPPVVRDRHPDHATQIDLQDHRPIGPPGPRPDVREFGRPHPVSALRTKVPLHQVARNRPVALRVRGLLDALVTTRSHSLPLHPRGDPMGPDLRASLPKLAVNPAAPVNHSILLQGRLHARPEPTIIEGPAARLSVSPGLVATARDPEYSAHPGDGMDLLLPRDGCELHFFHSAT